MTSPDEIAIEAYLFGYPLVITDVARRMATATSQPVGGRAPVNQFAHMRAFPDPTTPDVVSPNVDTLGSTAWLDVSPEPVVLSVPDTGKRYYMMPLLDAWTNVFASPGTRTTGNIAGDFVIAGPRWIGILPPNMTRISAPTGTVWLLGRTHATGPNDYDAVHRIQDEYRLTPLSQWGTDYHPPTHLAMEPTADTTASPSTEVARMDAPRFFSRVNALMATNPAPAADLPALRRFETLGIGPGATLNRRTIHPALFVGLSAARAKLTRAARQTQGTMVNGWEMPTANIGSYGTDYFLRARLAMTELGADVPADAMSARATRDSEGQTLSGANNYVIRFDRGRLPPVNGLWSVTMYDMKHGLVANPSRRFARSSTDELIPGDDGSIAVRVAHRAPEDGPMQNWLPAPSGQFNLVLRLHWPAREALDGTWRPPSIERVR